MSKEENQAMEQPVGRLEAEIEADYQAFTRWMRAGIGFDPGNAKMRFMMQRLLSNLRRAESEGLNHLPKGCWELVKFLEQALRDVEEQTAPPHDAKAGAWAALHARETVLVRRGDRLQFRTRRRKPARGRP